MCYETALTKTEKLIQKHFQMDFKIPLEFQPYYHRSGFTHPNLQIVKMDEPTSIYPTSWGYVPSWGRRDVAAFRKKYNTLNIKVETLFKGMSKEAALERRCLIIADGFFEPHKRSNLSVPYFCYIPTKEFTDGRDLFVFGGIYSELESDAHQYSCAILTMEANSFFSEIHNVKKRQPFVLDDGLYKEWFNPDLDEKNVTELIKHGFTSKEFKAYPVSRDLYRRDVDTDKSYILEREELDGLLF
ncbi:MAG: SOS response-associated peptidase family protein [Aequorivita sp.]